MNTPSPGFLASLTAVEAALLVRGHHVSPVDLVRACLDRIAATDPRLLAWERLDADGAMAAARRAEEAVARREALGPLHGVPFGAKDIFDTAGLRTAAGFPPYDGRVPSSDSFAVAALRAAGAILIGKTVTTQLAFVDPPATRNPYDPQRTPGGSSSGSGVAVAARQVPFALASQTGGSTLRPAAYNGVAGFKPSFGRISTAGVHPLAWSLDHVGVTARSVADCVLFLQATAPVRGSTGAGAEDRRPPRLALLRDWLALASDTTRDRIASAIEHFRRVGAVVADLRLADSPESIIDTHGVTMQFEAAREFASLFDADPAAFRPRLRDYVEKGLQVAAEDYARIQRHRRGLLDRVLDALGPFDALLLPTVAGVAPRADTTGDMRHQVLASVTGLPAISLPAGLSTEGLPLALQLVGHPWADEPLLGVAAWCERRLDPMPPPPLNPG